VHEYKLIKWHKPYMVIVHYSTLLPATQALKSPSKTWS